jgi:parallel beta-helix repeat protein
MGAYAKASAFLVVGTCSMKLRRFAILSSVFVCFSTAPAFARTLVVDNDGADCPQAEYNTIQQAVAAAEAGDKILVCPGRYLETVVVDETTPDLRIEAQGAPGDVMLVGTSAQLAGFYLHNTSGVLVQGFTVQGFGVPFVPGVPASQGANIRIEGGSGNTLRKNVTTLSLDGNGIQVINSSANVVEQNSSFGNTGQRSDGIEMSGELAVNNIIRHNETFENGQTGININGPLGTGNVVFGNRSHHNNGTGIRNISFTGAVAAGAHGTVIENNHLFANGVLPSAFSIGGGIIVGASHDVIVTNNRSEMNNPFGIRLQNGATDNLVEKNEVVQNTEDGIRLGPNVDANTVRLNLVRGNGRDGIRVDDAASAGNTIERNVLLQNAEHDAHDDSVPGANFWINNRCGAEDFPGQNENRPGLCENH